MGGEIEISLEETNKLRAQIGLPPIPSPGEGNKEQRQTNKENDNLEPLNSHLATSRPLHVAERLKHSSETNLLASSGQNEKKSDDISLRLQEAKVKSIKRRKRTSEVPLDFHDKEVKDYDEWLNDIGKLHNDHNVLNSNQSRTKTENRDERNRQVYSGAEEILTLKDQGILDESDDQLNGHENFKKKEELGTNIDSMINMESYSAMNNDLIRTSDDTSEEKKNESIRVDENPTLKKTSGFFDGVEEIDPMSIDVAQQKRAPVKMKKLKKKSHKKRLQFETSDMELQNVDLEKFDDPLDDNELESVLSARRRVNHKKRKNLTPEEIASEIRLSRNWNLQNDLDSLSYGKNERSLVYDQTDDFLESLNFNPVASGKQDGIIKKQEDNTLNLKKEDDDRINPSVEETEASLEPNFSGLGSTLSFLRSRNIIKEPDTQLLHDKEIRVAKRSSELLKIKIGIEERLLKEELGDDKQYMKLSKDEREKIFNRLLDDRLEEKGLLEVPHRTKGKKDLNSLLSSYNPLVQLSYKDDSGKDLGQKQAFKYLSHKFHGFDSSKKSDKDTKEREGQKTSLGPSIL
ncbi:uncharacterized protein PRCAT00000967001 [Priceomyces carsonii]|uniref:uncharacterized protein n=1 Tax=Priceomyces carsonii TaxID=28549 RepID=UPI002ED93C44|nr:unnamed protein product [Priceomyces carsonii]